MAIVPTIPGVKKSAKCLFLKRITLFQLCFTRTVLFLTTASVVLCARRPSCAPALGTLDLLLWGSLWSPTGANRFCGALETPTALPALAVLRSARTSVQRPGLSAVCAGELTIKARIVAKAKTCETKGTVSLPSTYGCGAFPPCVFWACEPPCHAG